ncbi:hypothetical protein [Streptomyces sp. AP-93]|uniref:hypothetical protein n=1 Tax=Streptomyces sp. AP-93 TaxID=2929048 RepID=UPI001FAE7B24|nr:hypothetical protein [Streptomyces sp. AP-93]MCJ0872071.1 hypothetical protein [Streptomyces sp. AP-93]
MNTEPAGAEVDVDELLERVWAAMSENEENMSEIVRLSDVSFRLWVDSLAQRLSAALGLSLSSVHAFFDDVGSIARRAGRTFADAYHDGYRRSRKVPPPGERPRRARA